MSKILKDDVMLDKYFGWSPRGHTRNRYRHYLSSDTMNAVLTLADGLNVSNIVSTGVDSKGKNLLKPIKCYNCDESNKPGSKFCTSCKFALSFDALNEVKNKELEEIKARMDIMTANMASLMKFIATQGKEPLDLVATHVKGVEYANAEEERKSLLQMGEVAREKRKKIGDVDLTLDNVKVKNE